MELIMSLAIHFTIKVFVAICLFKVNPYLTYAYVTLEGYKYFEMFQSYLNMKKFVEELNSRKKD